MWYAWPSQHTSLMGVGICTAGVIAGILYLGLMLYAKRSLRRIIDHVDMESGKKT
jgi:hypothetical protein